MLSHFDQALFQWIAGSQESPAFLVAVAFLCAKVLIYLIPLYLLLFWFYGGEWGRRVVSTIVLSVGIGLTLSFLLGLVFYRPRPFLSGFGPALMEHRDSASFPSNHALIFSVYATVLYIFNYRTAAKIGMIGAVLACWGRIYVGVHYPLDIIGGAVLGVTVAYGVVHFVLPRLPEDFYKNIKYLPAIAKYLLQSAYARIATLFGRLKGLIKERLQARKDKHDGDQARQQTMYDREPTMDPYMEPMQPMRPIEPSQSYARSHMPMSDYY